MPVLRKRGSGGAIPTVASANGALAAPKTATEFRAAAAQVAAQKQAQRAEFELMKKELEAKFEAKQLLLTQQEEAHRARAEELDAETANAEKIEGYKRCKRKAKHSAATEPPRLSCSVRKGASTRSRRGSGSARTAGSRSPRRTAWACTSRTTRRRST